MYSPLPDQEPFKPDGFIPQVPHTYAYHDADYGMVNEVQLSIAETTTQSKFAAFRVGTTVRYLAGLVTFEKRNAHSRRVYTFADTRDA
jgi:hypothetical protein